MEWLGIFPDGLKDRLKLAAEELDPPHAVTPAKFAKALQPTGNSATGDHIPVPTEHQFSPEQNMIDIALDDRVMSALDRNPYLSRRTLRFETQEGRVILRGEVSTFFQKQMAQESLKQVEGIDEISNELEVIWA